MRKAGFSRLSVIKELESNRGKAGLTLKPDEHSGNKTSKSAPLQQFQKAVTTITSRSRRQKQNEKENAGEFKMSHATAPDDHDRRPGTTMTDITTSRSDVLSRLNTSDQFRFVTEPNRKFQELKVCNIIKEILEQHLKGCEYNAKFCQELSPVIADAIKERVKRLVFPRYKIICHVLMGQVNGQSMRSVSRCAWNENYDNFAQHCFQTPTLYAIGVVYGVYAE